MAEPIAIVGASAAGLHAARILAQAGARVRVYERTESRWPMRTLIVTSAYRDILGSLGERAVVNEIAEFDLRAGDVAARIPLLRPDLIIERSILLEDLMRAAKEAGVEMVTGRRFTSIERDATGATLRFAIRGSSHSETVRPRTVIAADGATSDVAAALGFRQPPLVPLLQTLVDLPPDLRADTARVWFDPADTPYFYWLIPESPTRGALGVIGIDGPAARRALDIFRERLGLAPGPYQAARIPAYDRWIGLRRRLGALDAYVVGDAGGHVKVSTVGGIVTGFRGAEAVAHAVLSGDGSAHARRLRRELGAHRLIRSLLDRFATGDYERLLRALDDRLVRTLGGVTRDEPVRALLRAVRTDPALLRLIVPRRSR